MSTQANPNTASAQPSGPTFSQPVSMQAANGSNTNFIPAGGSVFNPNNAPVPAGLPSGMAMILDGMTPQMQQQIASGQLNPGTTAYAMTQMQQMQNDPRANAADYYSGLAARTAQANNMFGGGQANLRQAATNPMGYIAGQDTYRNFGSPQTTFNPAPFIDAATKSGPALAQYNANNPNVSSLPVANIMRGGSAKGGYGGPVNRQQFGPAKGP